MSAQLAPPIGASGWEPLSLPFDLRGRPVDQRIKSIWIRIPRPDNASGLYLERYQNAIQVFLDHQQIGGVTGEFTDRMSYWNTPLLVSLPDGGDYLYLHVVSYDYGPVIAPIQVGDLFVLNEKFEERFFWQVTTSRWTLGICLALAFFTFWLWLLRTQDDLFLKYMGACLSWSILTAYLAFQELPVAWSTALIFIHLSIDLTTLLLFSFINQATQLNADRLEKAWLTTCVLAVPLYILISPNYFFYVVYAVHFAGIMALLFALGTSLINVIKLRQLSGIWVVVALFGIIGLGLRDSAVFLFRDGDERLGYSNLSQFSGVFILLSLFGYLSHRFVTALNESEMLNRELEARVNRKAEELEVIYDRSLTLEVAESASREREKIYRDLHDDVGAKLVSIIQTEQSKSASDLARSALESLRAAIFQAKHPDISLNQLLEEYEEETRLRTEASGATLEWHQETIATTIKIPNPGHYHLARILREAVSNSLRADKHLVVSSELTTDQLKVVISNPSVTGVTTSSIGFGIENIQYRATAIGATVDWQHQDGLFTFTLLLAIPDTTALSDGVSPQPY
jgi:signal transduction histidine kinase